MNHVCPACGSALPERLREDFCPVCTLHGALQTDASSRATGLTGRIGDYELLEQIAYGGVGAVYKARQISLGRIVALKLLLAGQFADPNARQRFRAEAEATARLRHPNIVTIYEVGEHEGQPFIAMEFAEAGTLAAQARGEVMPARAAAAQVSKLARAAEFAHQHGIVHRDLKPSNVLLDTFGEPRITDFGLAKQLDSALDLTLTGQVLGSPSFMAPEQAAGRHDLVGPATDVYALGAILYQLTTGRPPFQGESAAAVIHQLQDTEPVSVRRLNPGVPMDLETVILKCLEKEPSRRYRTSQELADELDRFGRGEPVHAHPLSAAARGWRWCKQHPVRSGGIAALLTLLVSVAVVSSVAAVRIRRAERQATANLRHALLSEANAVRLGGRVGQRTRSLEALRALPLKGASDEELLRARNEVIAALALDDIQFVPQPQLPVVDHASRAAFNRAYTLYGCLRDGALSIVRADDGTEVKRLDLRDTQMTYFSGFSADDRFVKLYSRNQTSIWDLETGRECLRLNASIIGVVFHPAKPLVAVAERDGRIRFVELPGATETASWPPPVGAGTAPVWTVIQFSPNGKLLAAARARTNTVEILDVESGQQVGRWEHGPVTRIEWWDTGEYAATATSEGRISVWESKRNIRSWLFGEKTPMVRDFAWSPDGNLLAVTCADHNVWVWDSPAARLMFKIPCNADEVDFSADGRRLGPVWRDGVAGWLETVRSEQFREFVSGDSRVTIQQASFNTDGRLIAARGSELVRVHLTTNISRAADLWYGTILDAQFAPDGQYVWILHGGGLSRRRVNVSSNGTEVEKGPREDVLHGTDWRAMAFANNTASLTLVRDDQSVWLLNRDSVDPLPLVGATNRIRFAALSPNGHWLATLGGQQRLQVWDVATRELRLSREAPGVARLAFSPDGRWLATFDTRVQLLEVGRWTSGPKIPLPPNRPSGRVLTFAPDSRSLIVTTDLSDIEQIDVATGRSLAIFQAPYPVRVNGLTLSPDSHYLAAACDGGKVQVWDLHRVREVLAKFGLD